MILNSIRNILLDRDGTLIIDKHYLHRPQNVELLPDAGDILYHWQTNGIKLFIVTNQSGIGRGYFKKQDYYNVQKRLMELLAQFQVKPIETLFCPHAPEENCNCRKPANGMWNQLQNAYNLKPEETLMIGDKKADILFAKNCGFAFSALVLTGYGKQTAEKLGISTNSTQFLTHSSNNSILPDYIAPNLSELANLLEEQ